MIEGLYNYIEKYVQLSQEVKDTLADLVEYEDVKKNEILLRQGEYCNKLWFVAEGMLKVYYLHDGREKIKWLFTEGEIVTSMFAYFRRTVSDEFIQANENSKLVSISYTKSQELNKYPEMKEFSRVMLEDKMSCVDKVSRELSVLDTKDKYEYFLKNFPDLMQRAKLQDIASILGIYPESLSRIRAMK